MQYFGSNIVEGVAESWMEVDEARWRWVHSLVIPFDDIFKNLSLVVSYSPFMLHSGIIDHHHCTRHIPGRRFHLVGSVHILCNQVGRGGRIIENAYA